MKDKLLKMLKTKEARKQALATKADATEDVKELRSINTELTELTAEIAELRSLIAEIEAEEKEANEANEADPEAKPEERKAGTEGPEERKVLGTFSGGMDPEMRKAAVKEFEKRGADLKAGKAVVVGMEATAEERAVTIASSNLIVQKKYSNTLNETFNEVSSLIDNVNAVPLNGGESYTKGFEVSFGEGGYTTETGNYEESDPVTDYVEIGKAKITAYTEITDEAQKLPNIDYLALVSKNVRIAIRKKITKQILIGAGGTNAITGIFNAPTNVIPTASDLEFSAIDADTLDNIVLNYGGDEDVEGGAYLIINKKTLSDFAAARSTDGKKLYKIKLEAGGNAGTISSEGSFEVPFILNSAVAGFAAAAENAYFGAYGKLQAYEMPVFSPLTIEESRDFKFRTGQIAYRGSIWAGGNVVSYKGFVRLKKVAAV